MTPEHVAAIQAHVSVCHTRTVRFTNEYVGSDRLLLFNESLCTSQLRVTYHARHLLSPPFRCNISAFSEPDSSWHKAPDDLGSLPECTPVSFAVFFFFFLTESANRRTKRESGLTSRLFSTVGPEAQLAVPNPLSVQCSVTVNAH